MKINCIAIDHQQDDLGSLSEKMFGLDYQLAGTFTDPEKALKTMLKMDQVDVLLIDIHILKTLDPDLQKYFKSKTKKIIVTSPSANLAVNAFEFEADAFLLKPYSFLKLAATLEKLFLKEKKNVAKQPKNEEEDFFFIKSKNEKFNLIKIRPSEIVSVESLQNYIAIQTINKKVIAHLSLSKIKEILKNQEDIMQIHRSFLISKKYIEEIESNVVKMSGNINITVGGDYKNDLLTYAKQKTVQTGRTTKLNEHTNTKHTA